MQDRRPPRLLWIVLTLCAAVGVAARPDAPGQASPAIHPPATAQEKTAEKPPDYLREPFIFESLRTVAKFNDDGTGQRRLTARIRVQSEAGVQALGQLALGYNSANETMSVDEVKVLKADGSVVTAGEDAVQDLSAPIEREAPVYTDYRQKHVTVPGLRPGETLLYTITTTITQPLAPGHFWLEYNFTREAIVLDEQLEVTVPAGRTLKLKTQPREADAPSLSTEDIVESGERVLRWRSSTPARESDEEDEGNETRAKKAKRKKRHSSDVQLSTFQSWEEIGRWYGQLQRERVAPSDAIAAKARELTAGLSTDMEKIEGLYSYVARNFRYVSLSFGVGRFQPHAAAEVLSNQYGDCKDKHTLLSSLLEAAGLRAWPVLISSQRELDEDVPSPSQFDHVISAVPLGEELLWMDTTTEVAPFRLLSSNLRGKKALVIPSDGSAPRLIETPPDPPFPSTQRVTIEGSISELGKLEALVRYVLRGDNELPLRMAFRRTPQSRWKELGQVVAYSDGLGGTVTEVNPSDPADTSVPFRLEYRVSITNFLDWSSKQSQLRLPLPSIGMPAADADLAPDDDPIELGTPTDVITRLKLTIPEKYSARPPVPVGLKRDYAEYRSAYKVEGQVITAERTLRFLMREVPAARVRDYVSFARTIDSDEAQSIGITSIVAGTPAIPEAAKTDELFQAARAAVQNSNLKMAIELYKRVVEKDPKYKGAWLELGAVHSLMRQFDDAIAAFNKQIELNPYDERAYNSLGSVYRQQQKYDEAIKAFRKQLEISPLDPIAHIQLGDVYREIKRYDEAVVMLERAVVLAPRNAGLFVSLGDCYLNLKQPEKALEAFDKGLEISSSPTMLNNVAYQLALHGTHLDRAQQYAESAVASTAAQLRNVSLARLGDEDLVRVNSLAAYWDTLGWVLFQQGDLDRAERYAEASWLLAYHGEVGDHLAQIWEKRGHKEKAAQLYAQALAATRPNSETRARLAALVSDENEIEHLVRKAGERNSQQRTVKLDRLVKDKASAEFFVLLAPGAAGMADSSAADSSSSAAAATGSGAIVEDVKFISGDERLRPFADRLRSASFVAPFPDDTPTKIVRRGILSCTPAMGCGFVLMVPDDVTSVN
ncbi:MAG: DUF3857 domain-containing protein [Candidatus Acidiferrales bacterium]